MYDAPPFGNSNVHPKSALIKQTVMTCPTFDATSEPRIAGQMRLIAEYAVDSLFAGVGSAPRRCLGWPFARANSMWNQSASRFNIQNLYC